MDQDDLDRFVSLIHRNFYIRSLKLIMVGIVIMVVTTVGNFIYNNTLLLLTLKTISFKTSERISIITNMLVFVLIILLIIYGITILRSN